MTDPGLPLTTGEGNTARFWSKVDKAGECWNWTAGLTGSGYGRFRWDGGEVAAHRFAYELLVGAIPDGLQIDHLCRNRACVNPAHMEPVTQRENILRGVGRGAVNAAKTHCVNGHEFTPENTLSDGRRRWCRTCQDRNRRHRGLVGAARAALGVEGPAG